MSKILLVLHFIAFVKYIKLYIRRRLWQAMTAEGLNLSKVLVSFTPTAQLKF